MPLGSNQILGSAETQAGVSSKVQQAMEDLALKGQRQRMEKQAREAKALETRLAQEEAKELENLRLARLERMKREKSQDEKRVDAGSVTTIQQAEVIDTVKGAPRCVLHFASESFEQCALMDKRLALIARDHAEVRIVRILADKAPFFVEKFGVRTLPTLICFEDGYVVGKQVGLSNIRCDPNGPESEVMKGFEHILTDFGMIGDVDGKKASRNEDARGGSKPMARYDDDDEDDDEEENKRPKGFTIGRATKAQGDGDW